MKLYTEEQVNEILNRAGATVTGSRKQMSEYLMKDLTPIEIPSDEEIESGMNKRLFLSDKHLHFNTGTKAGFKLGAKWMKEQILNQNK